MLARLLTDERMVSVVQRMAEVTSSCIQALDSKGQLAVATGEAPPRPADARSPVQVGLVRAGEVRVWLEGPGGRAAGVAELLAGHLSAALASREAAHGSPLAAAHERLALAIDVTSDALWEWDLESQAMDVGPHWYQMAGLSDGSLPATFETWMSLVEPEDLKGLQKALHEAVGGTLPFRAEFRLRHADGQPRWVLTRGRVTARDGSGQPTRVSGINSDVTERKQQDEERRRLELALRQAEKLSAIGQLAGGVAHDFNNQLTAILGAAEVLGHRPRSADEQELVTEILAAANRSAELTRKLLMFSRRGAVGSAQVDVHQVIEELAAVVGRSVDRRIAVRQELGATRHLVTGDASALSNALLNLALNARDAMPQGGTLTFRTALHRLEPGQPPPAPGLQPGAFLRVEVADTGVGMSREVQARLFEPFFTTKPPGKGTGMGLASVYGAVAAHQGAVVVESAPGRGSTFGVFLPLPAESWPAVATPEPVREPAVVPPCRLLVIDDDALVRQRFERVLKALGHTVTTASGGWDGIDRFSAHPEAFDVVLLDVMMPDLSGREVLSSVLQLEPKARVVVVSGFARDGEVQGMLDAGARVFLQKPFTRAALVQALAQALGEPAVAEPRRA